MWVDMRRFTEFWRGVEVLGRFTTHLVQGISCLTQFMPTANKATNHGSARIKMPKLASLGNRRLKIPRWYNWRGHSARGNLEATTTKISRALPMAAGERSQPLSADSFQTSSV